MKILLLEEYLSEQEFRYTRSQGCQSDSRRDGFRSRHRDTLERQANVSETSRSEALCSDGLVTVLTTHARFKSCLRPS